MLTSQRLALRSSEIRSRLNELAGIETGDLTEEHRSEIDTLTNELGDNEAQYRAALLAEDQDVPEAPDRVELRSAVSLSDYLGAYRNRQNISGAAAELNSELKLEGNKIPFEIMGEVETRADAASASPSTTAVNLRPIQPFVFASSVAPMLGVDMPTVGIGTAAAPYITTALSASSKAKGAAAESSAAVIGVKSMTPKRVSARLTWRLEDEVSFGAPDFESALRNNLRMAMSDKLDSFILNDQDLATTASDPEGLIGSLTAATAATDVIEWGTGVGIFSALIDGLWSRSMMEIRALVNATVMAKLESTFREPGSVGTPNNQYSDTPGEVSLASYLRANLAGIMSHNRMPASASNVATGVAFRAGDGVMERPTTAVCANWGTVSIDDIFSDSASAETHVTVHTLVSDVQVLYPAAYSLFSIKTA